MKRVKEKVKRDFLHRQKKPFFVETVNTNLSLQRAFVVLGGIRACSFEPY